MKRIQQITFAAIAAVSLAGTAAWAAKPERPAAAANPAAKDPAKRSIDPIGENLFPPELVIKFADELGLDATQVQTIRTTMQESRGKMTEAQQKLAADTAALGELLRAIPPDTQKCLAQLDVVLDDERAIKRLTLTLMLDVKGKLTAAQIAKLIELRNTTATTKTGDTGVRTGGDLPKTGAGDAGPEALRAKMQDVRAKAAAKQQAGGDVSNIRTLMQEVQSLAQQGKNQEANAKLDEALNLLK